eukprot:447836_1
MSYKIGDYVQLSKKRKGYIRFEGLLPNVGNCYGIELDQVDKEGTDGSHDGQSYFQCTSGHGIFVKQTRILSKLKSKKKTTHEPPPISTQSNGNSKPSTTDAKNETKNGAIKNNTKTKRLKSPRKGSKKRPKSPNRAPNKDNTTPTKTSDKYRRGKLKHQATPRPRAGTRDPRQLMKQKPSATPGPSATKVAKKRDSAKATNGYPEQGTRKQQLEYLFNVIPTAKTSKEKIRLLKKTSGIIEDLNTTTQDDIQPENLITPSFIIKLFKKIFETLLKDKKFTVHRETLKLFNCLILCEFTRQAMVDQMVFSVKLLTNQLTHSNAKTVTAAKGSIENMIREVLLENNKKLLKVMIIELLRFAKTSKKKIIRKYCWVFVADILEAKYNIDKKKGNAKGAKKLKLPKELLNKANKGNTADDGKEETKEEEEDTPPQRVIQKKNKPPKSIMDALSVALKIGLNDRDKDVQLQAMRVLSLFSLLEETKADRLVSKMSTSTRKLFDSKYGKSEPSSPLPPKRRVPKTKRSTSPKKKSTGKKKGKKRKSFTLKEDPEVNKKGPKKGKKGGSKKKDTKEVKKGATKGVKKVAKKTKKTTKKDDKKGKNGVKKTSAKKKVKKGDKTDNKKKTNKTEEETQEEVVKDDGVPPIAEGDEDDPEVDMAEVRNRRRNRRNGSKQRSAGAFGTGDQDFDVSNLGGLIDEDDESPTPLSDDDKLSAGMNGDVRKNNEEEEDPYSSSTETYEGDHDIEIYEFPRKDALDGSGKKTDSSFSIDIDRYLSNNNAEYNWKFGNEEMIFFSNKRNTHLLMSRISQIKTEEKKDPMDLIRSLVAYEVDYNDLSLIRDTSEFWPTDIDAEYMQMFKGKAAAGKSFLHDDDDDSDEDSSIEEEEDEEAVTTIKNKHAEHDYIVATQISYNLMRLLTNEHGSDWIKQFIEECIYEIAVHALCVFHPLSSGNVYHGRVILEVLLNHFPRDLFEYLVRDSDVIQPLLQYAIFNNIHHGNLNSFVMDLICFDAESIQQRDDIMYHQKMKMSQEIAESKSHLLSRVFASEWKFIERIMQRACSKYCDDVSTKYSVFFVDLVARCASIEETKCLFEQQSDRIIDSFVQGLLGTGHGKELNFWQRIRCGQSLVEYLDLASRPTIMDPSLAATPFGFMQAQNAYKENIFIASIEYCLSQLIQHIPSLCDMISDEKRENESLQLSYDIKVQQRSSVDNMRMRGLSYNLPYVEHLDLASHPAIADPSLAATFGLMQAQNAYKENTYIFYASFEYCLAQLIQYIPSSCDIMSGEEADLHRIPMKQGLRIITNAKECTPTRNPLTKRGYYECNLDLLLTLHCATGDISIKSLANYLDELIAMDLIYFHPESIHQRDDVMFYQNQKITHKITKYTSYLLQKLLADESKCIERVMKRTCNKYYDDVSTEYSVFF